MATGEIGRILETLAAASRRPRYAWLVLGLIAEVAAADGHAGPHVGSERESLCDWGWPGSGRRWPRGIAAARACAAT